MSNKLRELSAAEAALACAKFHDVPEVQPAEDVLAAYAEPMDAAAALVPEQINKAFCPKAELAENGYCLIPCEGHADGGYATFKTYFPGATTEMLKWWYAWRGQCSANYAVSNPAHNHSVGMGVPHKEKVASPYLPVEAKIRGIIQSLVKHTGACELEDFVTHLVRPEDMEIDVAAMTAAGKEFIGGWWMREDRKSNDPYKKAIDMFAQLLKAEEGGVSVQTYVWCGYRGLKGKNVRKDSYGPVIDEAYAKQLGLAMAQEMAHLASILPELYAAEEGKL